jgi:hypothetical protein
MTEISGQRSGIPKEAGVVPESGTKSFQIPQAPPYFTGVRTDFIVGEIESPRRLLKIRGKSLNSLTVELSYDAQKRRSDWLNKS